MKRGILFIALVLGIVSALILVSATRSTLNYPGTTTETETTDVTINLEKGWNLVHGFANPEWIISGDISSSNIKAIYAFNPQSQEYVRFFPNPEDNKISKSNFRWDTYISQNSFWVYSDSKGRMTYKTFQFIPLESVSLFKGWNFVGFTNNIFYDDSFSWNKVKGNCNYEKIYAWNPENSEWMTIAPDLESFDLNDFLGMGMIIKVSENCKLGQSQGGSITNPPSIPNEGTESGNTGLRKDIEKYYYDEFSNEECELNGAKDYTSVSDCKAAWSCLAEEYAKLIPESDLQDLKNYMAEHGGESGSIYYNDKNPSVNTQLTTKYSICLAGKHKDY